FFQPDERQACTSIRFGTRARFVPKIIPPNADHFPPTLLLIFAGMPVAAVCLAESMKSAYRSAGLTFGNETDCSITGVMGSSLSFENGITNGPADGPFLPASFQ